MAPGQSGILSAELSAPDTLTFQLPGVPDMSAAVIVSNPRGNAVSFLDRSFSSVRVYDLAEGRVTDSIPLRRWFPPTGRKLFFTNLTWSADTVWHLLQIAAYVRPPRSVDSVLLRLTPHTLHALPVRHELLRSQVHQNNPALPLGSLANYNSDLLFRGHRTVLQISQGQNSYLNPKTASQSAYRNPWGVFNAEDSTLQLLPVFFPALTEQERLPRQYEKTYIAAGPDSLYYMGFAHHPKVLVYSLAQNNIVDSFSLGAALLGDRIKGFTTMEEVPRSWPGDRARLGRLWAVTNHIVARAIFPAASLSYSEGKTIGMLFYHLKTGKRWFLLLPAGLSTENGFIVNGKLYLFSRRLTVQHNNQPTYVGLRATPTQTPFNLAAWRSTPPFVPPYATDEAALTAYYTELAPVQPDEVVVLIPIFRSCDACRKAVLQQLLEWAENRKPPLDRPIRLVLADFSTYRLEHWLEKTAPIAKPEWITVDTARIPMDPYTTHPLANDEILNPYLIRRGAAADSLRILNLTPAQTFLFAEELLNFVQGE